MEGAGAAAERCNQGLRLERAKRQAQTWHGCQACASNRPHVYGMPILLVGSGNAGGCSEIQRVGESWGGRWWSPTLTPSKTFICPPNPPPKGEVACDCMHA